MLKNLFKTKSAFYLIFALLILGLVVFILPYPGSKAATTGYSYPSVTVAASGSLTVTPVGMSYGTRQAGETIAYNEGSGHLVELTIKTNTNTWDVNVSKDQDLTSGTYTIPSSNFTYDSVYVSGNPNNPNVYSGLEFGTAGSPSNVTDSPAGGAKAQNLRVDVRYNLTIPEYQDPGTYQATHTYTLTLP